MQVKTKLVPNLEAVNLIFASFPFSDKQKDNKLMKVSYQCIDSLMAFLVSDDYLFTCSFFSWTTFTCNNAARSKSFGKIELPLLYHG